MKYTITLLFFVILTLVSAANESSTKETTKTKTGTVIVKISNLENDEGIVFAHIYEPDKGFPAECEKAVKKQTTPINNGQATLIFENIPFGEYAVTTHHDKNENRQMDKNMLGMPTEGFGISNNVKLFMSLPKFDKCKFTLDKKKMEIEIEMKYL